MRIAPAAAAALLAVIWPGPRAAAQMSPDPTFGEAGTGVVHTAFGTMHVDTPLALRIQPDGRILVAGISVLSFDNFIAMSRYSADGVPDSTGFGTDGAVQLHFVLRDQANGIDLQDDGSIVAVGMDNTTNAVSRQVPTIYRFHPAGQIDDSFAVVGWDSIRYDPISCGEFSDVKVLDDGRILAAGRCNANANGGVNGFGVMRFLEDGSLDPNFDDDGRVRLDHGMNYDRGTAVFPDDDGVVWVRSFPSGAATQWVLARVNGVGTRNLDYGPGGIRETGILMKSGTDYHALIVGGDKLLLAGTTPRDGSTVGQFSVFRFHLADGTPDSTFGTNGRTDVQFTTGNDVCYDLAVGPGGKIVLVGRVAVGFGQPGLAFLTADGALDPTFAPDGRMVSNLGATGTHSLTRVLWLDDGRVLAAGTATLPGSGTAADFVLVRYASTATGVTEVGATAERFLSDVRPNPGRAETVFHLQLPRADHVRVEVLDLAGRRVARPFEGTLASGAQGVRWDGRDDRGRPLAAGVYFARVSTSEGTQTRKVTRLR